MASPLVPIIQCWQAVREVKQTIMMREKKARNLPFLAETLEMVYCLMQVRYVTVYSIYIVHIHVYIHVAYIIHIHVVYLIFYK